MKDENYQILEQIKYGLAITGKFDSSLIMFKEKTLLLFFQTNILISLTFQRIDLGYFRYQKIWKT